MTSQEESFEAALQKGQLTIENDGVRLDSTNLRSIEVQDLEARAIITMSGSIVSLTRRDYGHLLAVWPGLTPDDAEYLRKNPIRVGYNWRGFEVDPPFHRQQHILPSSNAIYFLIGMHDSLVRLTKVTTE